MNKRTTFEDDEVVQFESTLEKPTLYLNDYRWPIIESEEEHPRRKHKEPVEQLESVVPKPKIPIDFYSKPKSLNLSPQDIRAELKGKDESMRLYRPRVYKCPEVSLDDIPDKDMRDMITKFVYTSETHNFMEETINATQYKPRIDPECVYPSLMFNDIERLSHIINERAVSLNKMGVTSEEIKPIDWELTTGKEWDHKQQKFLGQPTKNFWMKKEMHGPDHDPSNIPMSNECEQYVNELLKKDKVRYPHLQTNFKGHKPDYPYKIALEKINHKPYDFWFTSNQSYGKHYLSYK